MNLNSITSTFLPVISLLEDKKGTDRPLWRDSSRHNGKVNPEVSRANGVQGYFIKACEGTWYQDEQFPRTWELVGKAGLYRSSYNFFRPQYNVADQMNLWFRINPKIDVLPRTLDVEADGFLKAPQIASAVWQACEMVKEHDGVYPIIYSRYRLVNEWLASEWNKSYMDNFYWFLAQYKWNRAIEHAGNEFLTIPNKVDRVKVLWHQTADKKPGFRGECESSALDYDRWEYGDLIDMHNAIKKIWGKEEPAPVQPELPDMPPHVTIPPLSGGELPSTSLTPATNLAKLKSAQKLLQEVIDDGERTS